MTITTTLPPRRSAAGRCKNCRLWESGHGHLSDYPGRPRGGPMGVCESGKMIYAGEGQKAGKDGIEFSDAESYEAAVVTGPDFGCVHWEAEAPLGLGVAEFSARDWDPGIRDVVAALWDRGLVTVDSGDGVSKPAPGIVLPFEHVAVVPGEDPDATMRTVAEALAAARPGEVWRIEYGRSRTADDSAIRETLVLYRPPGD